MMDFNYDNVFAMHILTTSKQSMSHPCLGHSRSEAWRVGWRSVAAKKQSDRYGRNCNHRSTGNGILRFRRPSEASETETDHGHFGGKKKIVSAFPVTNYR